MATYTITTTPEQEAVLTFIVQRENAQKDTRYTNAQYVALRFAALLQPFQEVYNKAVVENVITKFRAADAATQASVLALLG